MVSVQAMATAMVVGYSMELEMKGPHPLPTLHPLPPLTLMEDQEGAKEKSALAKLPRPSRADGTLAFRIRHCIDRGLLVRVG